VTITRVDLRDWRAIIDQLTALVVEGNLVMEAYGRPDPYQPYQRSTLGLELMNMWTQKVQETLPTEYRVDFLSFGRAPYKSDIVWAEQLDIQLRRIREIVEEIRTTFLQ